MPTGPGPPVPTGPHSSRGPGERPLKAAITGSNPVCGTSTHDRHRRDRDRCLFVSPSDRSVAAVGEIEGVRDRWRVEFRIAIHAPDDVLHPGFLDLARGTP